MESAYFKRRGIVWVILSTLSFVLIPVLFMSGSFRKFNKPSSSSNIAERAIGLFTDENITTTCDCNAYCAQVKKGKDTEPGYTYTNILRSSFLSNYSKGSGQQAIDINKSGKNKTGSSLEGKPNHGKFSLSVKRAILQIQQFSKKYQITKLVQEGHTVKYVFILTTWRSGSSFFGEALSSHPAIFYHFEPLMYLNMEEVSSSGKTFEDSFETLENLSHCEYSKAKKYMNYIQHSWNVLTRNFKIQSQCMELKEKCFDFVFLNTSCKIFPVQVFKLTRIRGQAAEELLKRFSNSKIIYLVRDPRAIYSSRMKVGWCPAQSPCGNTSLLCNDLEKDLAEIRTLQAKQAQNVHVVKYEHIALNPKKNLNHIYKFIGLDWHADVQKYLNEHIHKSSKDPMSTFKESDKHIDQWKYTLANETIQKVQKRCRDFMINLEYEFMK